MAVEPDIREPGQTQAKQSARDRSEVTSLAHAPTEDPKGPPPCASPGSRRLNILDRYTVLRPLGAGGMGEVYLVYDERLDRRVAIKLLLQERASDKLKRRLLREAQAMARLAHPNVVTVFEVGEAEGQVFIAMEYIQGGNLRRWLRDPARSRADILATFRAAGEGLVAAHEAGLVHRDFKPDNVLVGVDGRVLVADFGLAQGIGEGVDTTHDELDSVPASVRAGLRTRLTRTGGIVGTPPYMAAELLRGQAGDARSDQFAFCVALWEGLLGSRPYQGRTSNEVKTAILLERITEPEAHEVPAWLLDVVRRGLRAAPELRWPDMRTLLDALADDPLLRRRRRVRLGLGLGLGLGLVVSLSSLAMTELRANARHRYWNAVTEELLELERERSFAQLRDDARRAKNATRLGAYRSYRRDPSGGTREDPTLAALLLREVEGELDGHWRSLANATLGDVLSHAILTEHRDTVRALVLSPDGATLYSAAADGEVWRWDTRTGRGQVLGRHGGPVNAVALSPDQRFVASGSEDGSIQVWKSDALDAPALELRHDAGVTSLAFATDSTALVSASRTGEARVDALDGGASVVLRGHEGEVLSARFDRRDRRVLTAGADHSVRLWARDDGRLVETLDGHGASVYFAHFAPDTDTDADAIVTGADDGEVRVWRRDQLGVRTSEVLVRHASAVTALVVHGDRVASAAADRSVRVTPLDAPDRGRAITGHDEDVWSLAFTPDGRALITASRDGTARVTRLDGTGVPLVLRGHDEPLLRMALDGSGRWLATGAFDGEIRVWDLDRERLSIPLLGHTRPVMSVALDPADGSIISASLDGSARRWDPDGTPLTALEAGCVLNRAVPSGTGTIAGGCSDGSVVAWTPPDYARTLVGTHGGNVHDLAFSPEGGRLVSAGFDGQAKIWSMVGDAEVVVLDGHAGPLARVGFSHDGVWVYTAGSDGVLRRWDARSGELDRAFEGHRAGLRDFDLSPDAQRLATASDDTEVRLWLVADPGQVQVLAGHEQKVVDLSFDDDGARLLTSSADGTARLWSTREAAELAVLRGHEGTVWGAHFSADDRIITHADDGTVRLWSLDEPSAPLVLGAHTQPVFSLAVSPERTYFVSGSIDTSVRVWQLGLLEFDVERLRTALFAVTTACLDEARRQRELGESPSEARTAVADCVAHARRRQP